MSKTASRLTLLARQTDLRWIGVIVLAALAAACAGSDRQPISPVGPGAPTETGMSSRGGGPAASEGITRKVEGTVNGRFDFTQTWGSEWWQFYSDSDATGTLSHLGLSRVHTRHIPNFTTFTLEQGEFTIVAANGDEIHGTYGGSVVPDPDNAEVVHGTATFVVSGGTGRFTGATGTIMVTLLETLDDPSWASAKVAWTLTGIVKY